MYVSVYVCHTYKVYMYDTYTHTHTHTHTHVYIFAEDSQAML